MYKIRYTSHFKRSYKRLVRNNYKLRLTVKRRILILVENPLHPLLRTHKVENPIFGTAWSSRITQDIRLIWDYDGKKIVILLAIGSHSGKHRIYK